MINGIVYPIFVAPETQKYLQDSYTCRKQILSKGNLTQMMKTTFMANASNVDRKWYVVDATDVPLGRLSAVVASVLRGKTNQLSLLTQIQVISLSLSMLIK